MKPDPSLIQIELLERFNALIVAITEFGEHLRADSILPLWVSRTDSEIESNRDMRLKAIGLYQQLWYQDGQEGRETITCPGIIGASRITLDGAKTLNEAKDQFKTAVLALKALGKKQADTLFADLHKRNSEVAQTLRRLGTARLNLKQAYRHISYLDVKPVKVGFTWSKQGRTIQRISVAEARRLLERRTETPQTVTSLKKLASLTETEILARVRPVCPHLRANVVFEPGTQIPERRLVQTPLPLLVPVNRGEQLPAFVPIPPEPLGAQRLRRSDVRIEDSPFLAMLHVHRYKEFFR